MGLFSKEECVLCGAEVGSLSRTKLNDGTFLCSSCIVKTGINQVFSANRLKELNVEGIKKRIEYHEKDVKENLERISMFNGTYKVGGYIWFDDNHKWFVFPKGAFGSSINNSYVFKYDEIIDYEVLEDGVSITKGGLGKALIGGALFGLAGAIVGGTSKRTKEICNKLEIKVTTRNPDNPVVYLNLINTEFKKNGLVYKQASKSVQDILSKFQIVIDELEREKGIAKEAVSNVSVADEIKKFKELLDIGAITQEEFDTKKKELLG